MDYKLSVVVPVYNQENLILRALYSIPNREDIEVVIVNDGSTDKTHDKIMEFMYDKEIKLQENYFILGENKGVSNAVNIGIEESCGEYIVLLGSDDYFLPNLEKVIELINGEDLIYFNLQINDGSIWRINKENRTGYCGSVKLMRSEFIRGIKNDVNLKYGEDYYFFKEVLKRNPAEKFTGITAKHYNFPREGSLSWQQRNGK